VSNVHKERQFEDELCAHLAANGWHYSANDSGYDPERALLPIDILAWVRETQPDEWRKVEGRHKGNAEVYFLDRLTQQLDKHGSLHVLRHGFKDVNASFALCQFKPGTGLNPTTLANYQAVRCRVMRQVYYSTSNTQSIDLVFFVNGIPVATAELKTDLTQSVEEAIAQYRTSRLPRDAKTNRVEPLLDFKRRTLVHFAVSTDSVYMTTRLRGTETRFLPLNRGDNGAKGNPANPNGYRTSYLWERILERDAWLDIVGRFAHLEHHEELLPDGTTSISESLIFPRYHQWEAVLRLTEAARTEGVGHKYLIQHSAGSGKTNSISWLAHRLASLHNAADQKIFDSVIVVTDRTVLDSQLQDAIYQFEHKQGVVVKITGDSVKSAQLVTALQENAPIIIVTLQTFPFVLETLRKTTSLHDRNYAVIADEAHSSQTGNAAKQLKQVLTAKQLEEGEEVSVEDLMLADMAKRAAPENISYFAFTATPKAKTLELFGRLNADGLPESFHVYSMQQAIEEGFILDVLKNFTPYKLAFKLAHKGQEYSDETVEKSTAVKSLMRWVRLHPYNIAQKVAIIVEHFRENVVWRLDGHAKAMVVTASRKEAVRYKLAMDKYIGDNGYQDVRTLVAFSGDVNDPESGSDQFNEHNMNPRLKGRDLRKAFDTDDFNVMIVANKYQTGFDQPLLMAMYVDKRLAGVTAVQTLSRLNRTAPGKTDTFVLDFVNEPEEILAAFQPYYKTARLTEVSDPNVIHDLMDKLDDVRIYTSEDINRFAEVYMRPDPQQKDLQAALAPAVDRFRVRYRSASDPVDKKTLDALDVFRSDIITFVRLYDFLSQIVDYGDTDLEKRSLFFRHLSPLIRYITNHSAVDLSSIAMTHYQLKHLGQQRLNLGGDSDNDALRPITEAGSAVPREPETAKLSEIVQKMNELFEGELSEADVLNYASHIRDRMLEDTKLEVQAANNSRDQFAMSTDFHASMMDAVITGLENYEDMAKQVLSSERVRRGLANILTDLVYEGFSRRRDQPPQQPGVTQAIDGSA
jgi:type I restriction enzyme R subunit